MGCALKAANIAGITHFDNPETTELLGVSFSESELMLSESDCLRNQLKASPEVMAVITCRQKTYVGQ